MMVDPTLRSVWPRSSAEPVACAPILPNFDKALLELRAAIGTFEPRPVVRSSTNTPNLAPLPTTSSPRKEFLLSALLHTSILATVVNLPILFPPSAVTAADRTDAELRRDAVFQPLFLPILPPIDGTSRERSRESSANVVSHAKLTLLAPSHLPSHSLKPDYVGPQVIISSAPHSPKGVQTILRPDLVESPKLAYPVPLPSLVILPAPALPASTASRQLESSKTVRPNPKGTRTVQANEPTLELQRRTVDMPKLSLASEGPAAPAKVVSAEPNSPRFRAVARPEIPAPKAVVVVNAVNIPSGPLPPIPDAQLASRFVIRPPTEATGAEIAPEDTNGKSEKTDNSHAKEKSLHEVPKNAHEGEAMGVHADPLNTGSSSNVTSRPRPNEGIGLRPGNTKPGLVISGGVRGRDGRTDTAISVARPSYGLTIISGGNSGGASRDMGVFSRNDTVYTVYIPMADVGGGAPCPMEYALLGAAPMNSGLLAPPVVLKKVPATESMPGEVAGSAPVFLTAVIDENGKLQNLRALHASDLRAQSAMDALRQWEFEPAELDGKPVRSKVLIGISVPRPKETRKENQ